MENRKRTLDHHKAEQAQLTLKRRAHGRASYVAGDDTLTVIGGKTHINGQPRFIPLGTRRVSKPHCKSCGSFRQSSSCALDPDAFTDAEADACDAYWNRTHDREARYLHASFM